MEMLAANKMDSRRISAAGWQEGESDVGRKRGEKGCGVRYLLATGGEEGQKHGGPLLRVPVGQDAQGEGSR